MTSLFLIISLVLSGMDVGNLSADLHIETGMAYISQGLPDKALGEFVAALEISESASEAHLGLARIAVINSSFTTAEEEYTLYMSMEPDDYRAPLEMAETLLQLSGRTFDALEYAETALELAPLNANCWMILAGVEGKLGNTEEAISWYSRTIIEDPESALEARVQMGALLFSEGDLYDAREVLLPAAQSGVAEAHHFLALIYLEQKDDLRAIDSINRYLYIEPNGLWADSARECLELFSSFNSQSN